MTLKEQVAADLADAMRAKDETRKTALRMLIAAMKNAEIEARKPLDEAAAVAVLQKQVKQRRESILAFQEAGRQDLVAKEEAELGVLGSYMPEEASREEVEAAARQAVADTGASGPRDLGKVMPILTKQFAGRADGRLISEIVRGLLGG